MTDKKETCECEGVRIDVKRAPKGVTIQLQCCEPDGEEGKRIVVCCGEEEAEAKKD